MTPDTSESTYRRLFDRNVAGTWRASLDGEILDCNRAFAELFGFGSPDEARGRPVQGLYAVPQEGEARLERLREEGALEDTELELQRRDGSPVWALESAFLVEDGDGEATAVGTVVDITDRKRLESRMERMGHRDSLTGLPNRRLLLERAAASLSRADRLGERVGLIFLDIARFARVNDAVGREGGDEVLVTAAKRLDSCLRTGGDLVARVGGDEFVALVPDVEVEDDLRRVAERFAHVFREPFRVDGEELELDLRMGLALYPDHGSNVAEVLERADHARFRADADDADGVAIYAPVTGPGPDGGLAREEDLRRALDEGELELHYQPIHGLEGDGPTAAEGLVRWRHPEAGLLRAAEFVPLAQRTDLVAELDEWVLRAAVDQIALWASSGDGPAWASVNLSASTLERPDLPALVDDLLASAEVPGSRLGVEIAERIALREPEGMAETIEALRERDVRVAIDDFGTGQSVLAYLQRYEASILKLDMVLVHQMGREPRDAETVAGIAALAREMGMEVMAEGVETPEQLSRLGEMQVDMAQGHHLGRPAPAEELATG